MRVPKWVLLKKKEREKKRRAKTIEQFVTGLKCTL
jgi:hypothetical protein